MVNLHLKVFGHYNKATKTFMAVCRQNEFAVFLKDVQHDYLDNFMQLLKLQIQPITVLQYDDTRSDGDDDDGDCDELDDVDGNFCAGDGDN